MGIRHDLKNQLSAEQAFTGGATVSTNSYYKQTAAQDLSIGRRMALRCIVTTAAGAGSTHLFQAIQADNAALTTNKEVLGAVSGLLAANLTKGTIVEVPIPQGSMTRQYIGFQNSSSGGTTTISLDVYLVPQDENEYYKSFPKKNHPTL